MRFRVVIPARLASTRLPEKPLRPILGEPMIRHVCRRALEGGAEQVVVATDAPSIAEACDDLPVETLVTSGTHASGTDRIAEVVARLSWPDETIVVNLQGDEPLMPPVLLRQVAEVLRDHPGADIATLCTPIVSAEEFFDPHVVKVVCDDRGRALYFSRAPIPFDRDEFVTASPSLPEGVPHLRHLGIYAYRAGFLRRWPDLPHAAIERSEMLEQLRALVQGARIQVAEAVEVPGPGVDTAEDLLQAERLLAESASA